MEWKAITKENDAPSAGEEARDAVNSTILDYYKKFGKKRDLEQYFSLSTAQSDIRDTTSLFWKNMKSQNDSSDSGEKNSESSQELCRISIKCSLPEPSSSQDDDSKEKSDSQSPPIITEEVNVEKPRHSADESLKSDDNNSQKSLDVLLDTSANKVLSPSSSITSQRKLEWDSLGDVGYGNESERKTSASSLSTLERLALKQQYSNNNSNSVGLGLPTAHSTLIDENEGKAKNKKGLKSKVTKVHKKDVDFVEINVPQGSETNPIHVNLTKHISFSVEKDGGLVVDNSKKTSVTPEKKSFEAEEYSQTGIDKAMQTTLTKSKEMVDNPQVLQNALIQRVPVLINVNSLRKRIKRKKLRATKRKIMSKRQPKKKEDFTVQEKTGEQVSEAESFEYMPGHIYNQNQLNINQSRPNITDFVNKSSLESSGVPTTDSSKGSKHSFTDDLEKSINLLKGALDRRYNNSQLKKKLIKEVVHRLLTSNYRGEESSTDFLSGLSFNSKKLGLRDEHHTTSSTSDGNNTVNKEKLLRPKKSILRMDKFKLNDVPSTSQSVPNLSLVSNIKQHAISNSIKSITSSNNESDVSSKDKKTSSEELYQKYIEALKREEAYKKHLKDKEMFMRRKLVCSDTALKPPPLSDLKVHDRLKSVMKDLTRNHYDDGSGDASKLEGYNRSVNGDENNVGNSQKNHSVFTLSSGHSDCQCKKPNLKKRQLKDTCKHKCMNNDDRTSFDRHPDRVNKIDTIDSSVQVNIKCHCSEKISMEEQRTQSVLENSKIKQDVLRNMAHIVSDQVSGDIQFVCLCNENRPQEIPDNFLIYKCSRLTTKGIQLDEVSSKSSHTVGIQCFKDSVPSKNKGSIDLSKPSTSKEYGNYKHSENLKSSESSTLENSRTRGMKTTSKTSQTNLVLQMLRHRNSPREDPTSIKDMRENSDSHKLSSEGKINKIFIHETTRSIQTEISIDPKISDPSLSDITIIANKDCVNIVSEKHKEVVKSSSESDNSTTEKTTNNRTEYARYDITSNYTNKQIGHQKYSSEPLQINTNQPAVKMNKKTQSNDQSNVDIKKQSNNIQETGTDNFKLPIQGTNMTLMVSIGSNIPNMPLASENNVPINKDIGHNDHSDIFLTDKSTCLREECSKGVQSQDIDIFTKLTDVLVDSPYDDNLNKDLREDNTNREDLYEIPKSHDLVNNIHLNLNSNTFPKSGQINQQKPFLRSNTDTNKFNINVLESSKNNLHSVLDDNVTKNSILSSSEGILEYQKQNTDIVKVAHVQTDVLINKDVETQESMHSSENNFIGKDSAYHNILHEGNANIVRSGSSQTEPLNTNVEIHKDTPETSKESNFNTLTDKSKSLKNDDVNRKNEIKEDTRQETSTNKDIPHNLKVSHSQAINSFNPFENSKGIKSNEQYENFDKHNKHLSSESESQVDGNSKDPILDMIKDITRRYSKSNIEKDKRSKCFKEIMTVLNYLLDTDDGTDNEKAKSAECAHSSNIGDKNKKKHTKNNVLVTDSTSQTKNVVDKAIQSSIRKSKSNKTHRIESSDIVGSTDLPATSSDSATCKVLHKIKKECDKYHQKRCKCHSGTKKCEVSSSTSANCDQCKRTHHCPCKTHKTCKCHRPKSTMDKVKKFIAYNLIIQTSDSMMSGGSSKVEENNPRPLQNVIVKVPPKMKQAENIPFKELSCKLEKKLRPCSPQSGRKARSRSLPDESDISSVNIHCKKPQTFTVREYLEQNRPDFVEKCTERQNCLKIISETRGNQRAAKRNLVSLQLEKQPTVSDISERDLRRLARDIGVDLRRKKGPSKFISELEMKKHSEKIYKSLPEVVQKKEEKKKENIKKTNLLMANIFKKNLQKKTLRGAVNISNYSTVIKI